LATKESKAHAGGPAATVRQRSGSGDVARAPVAPQVVFALAYQTWADAVVRDMSWSADQMMSHLLADPDLSDVLVADPLRSQLARLRRRPVGKAEGFPEGRGRALVHPRRWRRWDGNGFSNLWVYRGFDRWLSGRAKARGLHQPVLVTNHPVHAAVADRTRWRDVVYYAWDDWLEYPPLQPARPLHLWAYRRMAELDTNVIGVTRAVVDNIGATRSVVVPNGVTPESFDDLPPVPPWFRAIDGPVAFYAGTLESRVDVSAVQAAAAALAHWTFVLVGPLRRPDLFSPLSTSPNVMVRPPVPRAEVLAMATEATVCLIPHRETAMSTAMSPLKLYEYLGAGAAVVATDLPPVRGISDRCLLVPPGAPFAEAILAASRMPPQPEAERRAFLADNSWSARYAIWRAAALGG
jgi:glycosyltransferase involved in cell wall biosynthesis